MPDHPLFSDNPINAETRAFILRLNTAGNVNGYVVTVDDVATGHKSQFLDLEIAFAEIRRALNLPDERPGQPH